MGSGEQHSSEPLPTTTVKSTLPSLRAPVDPMSAIVDNSGMAPLTPPNQNQRLRQYEPEASKQGQTRPHSQNPAQNENEQQQDQSLRETPQSVASLNRAGVQSTPTASGATQAQANASAPPKDRGRKRRRTTPSELEVLETEFMRNNKPSRDMRERIAERLGMEEKAVQIWFQNKRQSCRRRPLGAAGPAVRSLSVPQAAMVKPSLIPPRPPSAPVMMSGVPPALGNLVNGIQGERVMNNDENTPPVNEDASKKTKSLRLTMSADGKAQLVMRSPLKPLRGNSTPAQSLSGNMPPPVAGTGTTSYGPVAAGRFASMPAFSNIQNHCHEAETECARNLMFLKTGSKW